MSSVRNAIIDSADYYSKTLSRPVLEMYLEDLADLPEDEVIAAYKAYRRNPKNTQFPLPSHIRAIIQPAIDEESQAREVASRVLAAIPKFGYMRGEDAEKYIGSLGWHIVGRYGGWKRLCEQAGVDLDLGVLQAQIRDIAKATAKYAYAGQYDQPIALPEPNRRDFLVQQANRLTPRIAEGNSQALEQFREIMKAVKTLDGGGEVEK